jgi:hypothetical protein
MKAFICHYTKLTERKKHLEQALPAVGLNEFEWVTENDILSYPLDEVYDPSPEALAKRNATDFARYGIKTSGPLKKAVIEVTLQHFEAYRSILDQKLPMAVVFEDDVMFKKSFAGRFPEFIGELPEGWDVFYFGRGCGGHRAPMTVKERFENLFGKKNVFRNEKRQSRFTDSYVLTSKAAEKILSACFPFHFAIDWELNYLQIVLDMNVYWSEPALTFQGSKFGSYGSSLKKNP